MGAVRLMLYCCRNPSANNLKMKKSYIIIMIYGNAPDGWTWKSKSHVRVVFSLLIMIVCERWNQLWRSIHMQTYFLLLGWILSTPKKRIMICIPAAAAARGHIVCWIFEVSAVSPHMHTCPPRINFCWVVLVIPSKGSAL